MLFCDLDGDRLQDLALLDGNKVSVFYQATNSTFNAKPAQEISLGEESGVLCAARLGRQAESLLLATSDGVREFAVTNRTASQTRNQIIQQQTLIPKVASGGQPSVAYFPLTVETTTNWPLVLLPVEGGLQVWQHRQQWQAVQTLSGTIQPWLWPAARTNPGYARVIELEMSLGDFNGDGRGDLLLQRQEPNGLHTHLLYLQGSDGLFALAPAMIHTEKPDDNSWLCWVDLNRDGKVDLIKSTRAGDPWFFPGAQSGKVSVGAYLADVQGHLPVTPQQVFRKNDAMSAVPVADLDGDGYADLVLGSAPFDSREGVRRMLMTKQLSLTLKFHFYRPGAGYSVEPDCKSEVLFQLDYRSFYIGSPPREYFENVVNFSGDFDGDGKRDMLVRDRPDHLSVYPFISREKGFSREAKLQFDCGEPFWGLEIKDLNGNGASDLVVKTRKANSYRIFVSYR